MNCLAEKSSLECGNCSFKDRWLLHRVRLRGEYRRLCTSCVLKLHPTSFCPICFENFSGSVPYHERLICQKCPSISHTGCVANSENVAKSYTCLPCIDPEFAFFNVKRNSDDQIEIDVKNAKVLLCAARIAAESMSRAVLVAEADAHRRVKEAATSRRRAKEALEEMSEMVAREKVNKVREESSVVAGYANRVDKNGIVSSSRNNVVAGSSIVVPPRSSSQIGQQNRTSITSKRGVVLGSGGNQSNMCSVEDGGRCMPAANRIPAPGRPQNMDNVVNTGNADGKHGSSPSRPAEDKK